MEHRRFGLVEFGIGLLLGMAAGAIIGLLVAPQSGTQARNRLANRATDIRSTASDLVGQAMQAIEVAISRIEKIAGLQERNLRKKLDEIKSQLEEYHLSEA